MISFPNAKINIGLYIVAKRADGYHDIETIFYPTEFCDALEFIIPEIKMNTDLLTTTGIDTGSATENNLVMKTVKKLHEKYNFPFIKIHLHKSIPSGAGLGGGSSDAACMMKAVNRVFNLGVPRNVLRSLSLELGSDCPFFIDNTPAIASGRGEILKPVEPFLKGLYLVLLNPQVGISTKEAYENCMPAKPEYSLSELVKRPVAEWRNLIVNDFEDFAIRKHHIIGEIKKQLYSSGAIFSLMSGSGSTVFGLFSEKPLLPENLKKFLIHQEQM